MTAAVATDSVVSFLRRRRRVHRRRPLGDVLIDAYSAGLALVVAASMVGSLFDAEVTAPPSTPADLVRWLPAALLVGFGAVLAYAAWQGPVLFAVGDLQWLLAAPIDRERLIRHRLARSLLAAAAAGALLGLGVATAVRILSVTAWAPVAAAAAPALAALGVLATALSWQVERSPRWSRIAGGRGPLVVAAGGMVGWLISAGGEVGAMWSGPWGWAAAPVAAAVDGSGPWIGPAVLLAVATAGAVISAWRTPDIADDELWRRARSRSAVAAAAFFGDLRGVAAVARGQRRLGGTRWRRYRMPRWTGMWAVAGRDVLALRRAPANLVWAGGLVAAGAFAATAAARQPLLVWLAFGAFYAAASRLIETLRLDADQPGAHRMLPLSWGEVVVMHALVPAAALGAMGWVAALVAAVSGTLPPAALPVVLPAIPLAAAVLVLSPSISGARRGFPLETLVTNSESGALLMVGWLVTGPAVAAAAWAVAFAAAGDLTAGITPRALLGLAVLAAGATLLAAVQGNRRPPD